MKKQKKQLLILLAILLVCVLGLFGATFYSAWVEIQEEIAEADYAVLSFEDTDLTQIHVVGSAGELTINYDGSEWTFENDINAQMDALNGTDADDAEEDTVEYEVNATTASTLMGYLDSLTSEYAITPNEDLSEYGLEDPSMTITLTMSDGTVYSLVFGDYNEMLGEYYYYLDDASTLYTISSYTYNILNKTDTDLADEVEEEEEEEETESEEDTDAEETESEEDAETAETESEEDAETAETESEEDADTAETESGEDADTAEAETEEDADSEEAESE